MTAALESSRQWGPWPGPRPYREADRDCFFGRDEERELVLDMLEKERLVLLSAASGVGKTSFLRACLVPRLRYLRRASLAAGRPARHSPVIVVRDWIIPALTDPDQFMIGAISAGIQALDTDTRSYDPEAARLMREDRDALIAAGSALGTSNAFEFVAGIARATGGLSLVLDQFEEALQGTREHNRAIIRLIARLYGVPSIRMLLSFRQEYSVRTDALGVLIGDLTQRKLNLPALGASTLRDALLDSAQAGGVDLDEDVLGTVLSWMDSANTSPHATSTTARSGGARRPPPRAGLTDSSVDLLNLQSLLLHLYGIAARDRRPGEPVAITERTLNELRASAGISDDSSDGAAIIESALSRFIESLLPLPAAVQDASGLTDPYAIDAGQARQLRWRRAIARLAPSFFSGGFKVQQEQAALLARAWREEWEVLDIEVELVEDELARVAWDPRAADNSLGQLFAGHLEDSPLDAEAPEVSLLSGIARRNGWTIRATAVDLIRVSLEALDVLCDGGILRRKRFRSHVTYELVHDGFGDVLFSWAEDVRAQPLDALAATTAERGTTFRWQRLTGSVLDATWHGCWLGPDPDPQQKRLIIEDVTFENCDLRGAVFHRCDFRGGSFRNCNLSGAAFWDCTFEGTEGRPFRFDGVSANGLSFDDGCIFRHVDFVAATRLHNMSLRKVSVDRVRFHDCTINQLTVRDVELRGPLSFQASSILLSNLVGLSAAAASPGELLEIGDCDLYYCRLDDTARNATSRDQRNRLFPDPREVGAEPELRRARTVRDPWRQPGSPSWQALRSLTRRARDVR